MENLLAFIEFTQFQLYLKENMDVTIQMEPVRFPSNIPMSVILEEKKNESVVCDAKIKAYRIYEKYVAVGSEFEINVSFDARQKAVEILDDLDMLLENKKVTGNHLFQVFMDCSEEIWYLLMASYGRFRKQPEFKEFDAVNLIDLPALEIHFTTKSDTAETPSTPTIV